MTQLSKSRRNFIKNSVAGSALLAGIPVLSNPVSEEKFKEKNNLPRLPLKIVGTSGLSHQFEASVRDISDQIDLKLGMSGEQLQEYLPEAEVFFGWPSEDQLKMAKNMKWVQSPSAGVERLLYPEMMNRPITLTNAKGCYGPAIGEHVFALLFGLTRGIKSQVQNMNSGSWSKENKNVEMREMTMGIIGLGGIGRETARRAKAMDMKVIAADIVPLYTEKFNRIADEIYFMDGGGFEEVLRNSDVIVSAAPHTDKTEGIFDKRAFELMKPGAYFINVSRGKLVKTPAMVEALKNDHLAGAGLDVTDPEPLPQDHELWSMPNVVITSHIAARSQYSADRMMAVFSENVQRYVNGYPLLNLVDKEMGF